MSYINPKEKVLWHLEELSQLQNKSFTKAPVNVEIDLTNRCNHGCSWCHFAYTHTKGPLANSQKPIGYLDTGDVFDFYLLCDIVGQLKEIGVKSITWTGGGEPTLYPFIKEIVDFTHFKGLDQGIYTNGSFINAELASVLKANATFVYVSLDECTREDFKLSKGVDRFDKVLTGIERLVNAEGKATVGVGFLLHEKNYQKIDEMRELGKSLNIDYVQFRPIIDFDLDNPSIISKAPNWIYDLKASNDEFYILDNQRFMNYLEWQGHEYKTCNWTALQTIITPNGKVWSCVNKRGIESALVGDLTVESFADIWRRSGKSCSVDSKCRIMCRGHLANLTLDKVLSQPSHENFI